MVKRYPHIAIVTIESDPVFINGKCIPGDSSTIEITGRYDSDGKTIKLNELGNEVIVKGAFYTKAQPPSGKVVGIKIELLGIDSKIISWDRLQSHSVISI